MLGELNSAGFVSSIKYDNLTPWYTTSTTDEIISFVDSYGNKASLNSLFIEANSTPLYVRILPSDYCLYIPANDSRNYDMQRVSSIQIMGASGQSLRWSGMYF